MRVALKHARLFSARDVPDRDARLRAGDLMAVLYIEGDKVVTVGIGSHAIYG